MCRCSENRIMGVSSDGQKGLPVTGGGTSWPEGLQEAESPVDYSTG